MRWAFLVALAALGCRSGDEPLATAPAVPSPRAPASSGDARSDEATGRSPVVPESSRQLILGRSPSWGRDRVELRRYRRAAPGGPWQPVGDPVPATIGARGMAWGIGHHGHGAPGVPGPVKVEGDSKSPAGVFAVGAAFGYDDAPPAGTAIEYVAVDGRWRCVDDPGSRHYNRVLSIAGLEPDWSSAEAMRRSDELYRRGLFVDHNRLAVGRRGSGAAATPGGGSCIFFHVWAGPQIPTVGCTALERDALEELITWLEPGAEPVAVLLPDPVYRQVRDRWKLP